MTTLQGPRLGPLRGCSETRAPGPASLGGVAENKGPGLGRGVCLGVALLPERADRVPHGLACPASPAPAVPRSRSGTPRRSSWRPRKISCSFSKCSEEAAEVAMASAALDQRPPRFWATGPTPTTAVTCSAPQASRLPPPPPPRTRRFRGRGGVLPSQNAHPLHSVTEEAPGPKA